jgi:hypothetical protein
MKTIMRVFSVGALGFCSLCGGAGFAQPGAKSVPEASPSGSSPAAMSDKAARFAAVDKHNITLTFDAGKSGLTASDKSRLDDLIKALPSERKRLRVTIAAWSDKPFPIENGAKLSSADEKLAEKRVETIFKHLKSKVKFYSIEKVNMAKKANVFAHFFSTDDAKMKAAFEGAEANKPWVAYEAKQFRENGGPSKAMVVIFDKMGLDD